MTQLNLPGTPAHWAAIGFSVADHDFSLGQASCHVGAAAPSWAFAGGDSGVTELSGIETAHTQSPIPRPLAPSHPNQAFKIDHVVVASASPSESKRELEEFGFVASGERPAAEGQSQWSQSFFWSGELLIELVGPIDESADSAPQAEIWGVTFVVNDFGPLRAVAGGLVGAARPAAQPGRQIATVGSSAALGVAVAFMTPHVKRQQS